MVQGPGKIKEILKNTLVALITLILCTLVGEVLTRIFWASPEFKYPQTLHRRHEILGWEMIPDQKAYTYSIPVSINSHGLRDDEFPIKKPLNTVRILHLGDSVTFGILVEGDETYPNQLEKMLNQAYPDKTYEAINTGVQRYYTYQEVDYLKLKGLEYEPDIVVLGFYINDLGIRPTKSEREYEKDREQIMSELWQEIPFIMHIVKNSALINLVRDRYFRIRRTLRGKSKEKKLLEGVTDEKIEILWKATKEYLSELQMLAGEHNFKLLIVAFPSVNQVILDFPDAAYPAKLEMMAKEMNIPFISLVPVFKKHYTGDIRSLYFRYNGHPNAYAHKLAAESIFKALVDYRLLPAEENIIP